MELRSGHPFWLIKNGIISTYPSLRDNATCEVVVIGAGVTGAFLAYKLSQAGVSTIVLDKRDVATGSTAASTALLQHAADTELRELAVQVGEAAAVRSYRLGLEAIDHLESLVTHLRDDCGFERKSTLYLASKKSAVENLRSEYVVRRRHGFDVEFLDAAALKERFAVRAPAGILCGGDAQVDAVRLTHALFRKATSQGARVFDRSEVTAVENRSDGVCLTVSGDVKVHAKHLVFATGYESSRYLKQNVGKLSSTFAIITEPIAEFPIWPGRCLIWETARPYTYFRTTADDRILVGGEDIPFASALRQHRLIKVKAKVLERRFRRMFPKTEFELAFSWSGTFGSTKDGLPYIGKSPEWPHSYFALGYGGNGITMGWIAADLIADAILGRQNSDAGIFRFDR